jgi:heme-degrading monooxygenase HmoA
MFARIGIHYPKSGDETITLNALHKFQQAQKQHKGLIAIHAFRDEKNDVVIGLALWDSKQSFLAVHKEIQRVAREVKFELYDEKPPLVFSCEEA